MFAKNFRQIIYEMKRDGFLRSTIYNILRLLPDKLYLSLKFYKEFKRLPNWKDPKTFNEKMQWLKLYNRKPEYTIMVDKYEAKRYVADIIGEEYIIPTLGVWDKAEDIDFDALPEKFVLKTTHDSGSVVICEDKSKLDRKATIDKMRKSLKRNFYAITREWPYKNVKPRIIAEQYIENNDGNLQDYKIHNFGGEPKIILVCKDRFEDSGLTEDFFDVNWNHLNLRRPNHPNSSHSINRPNKLQTMLRLARKLSAGHPFMRTDFYEVNDKVYFGEITFFPSSGTDSFIPSSYDKVFGDWIKL